jgi:EAL domain-containing protein (putative c-di-GMP-specific phosphodiesterase class I)/response regulator RpfG family c-di-GMP phosphodiesterase
MPPRQSLRLLIVDSSDADSRQLAATLTRANIECDWTRVEDEAGLLRALDPLPDAVVCDYHLPELTAARVSEAVSARDPECPLIVVSRQIDDAAGAALINGRYRDFVRKDALARLPAALRREVQAAETRRRLSAAIGQIRSAPEDALEPALRAAIAQDRLALHYQPQVDLHSGRLAGLEALARWEDPVLGTVPPSRFIPVAERSDLAIELGRWALRAACRQIAHWTHCGHRELRVSVNLSGRHFTADSVVEDVGAALAEFGVEPRQLQIEITENTLVGNVERAVAAMRRLAARGVHFALDDFGTGYSSLAYLRQLPLHEIKVDRSFVAEMTQRAEDAVIVRTIIAMAHSLGVRVVAEGIETEAQLAALRRVRCDLAQGYLLARPAPPAQVEALLAVPAVVPAADDGAAERTLLIVDDEPNIAASLKRVLRQDGYRILTAEGAAEGYELLAKHEVGVVLSDQRMPTMSGTDFLVGVKDMYPNTVRMVLTGFTDLESVTAAVNNGAVYKFLTKPWEDDLIRARIKDAFAHYELSRENERLSDELRRANVDLSEMNVALEQHAARKTEALERQLAILQVSQEALDRLPLGVIGVDVEGMVVTANEYAVAALGAAPGTPVASCLPGEFTELLRRASAADGEVRAEHGSHAVICRSMGGASRPRGHLLIAVPASL